MSNRAFISRLCQWGATVEKTKGEDTHLRMPDGCRKTVRSEHHHQGNSAKTCIDLVTDCLGTDWNTFATTLPRPLTEDERRDYTDLIKITRLDEKRGGEAEKWADVQWFELPSFVKERLHQEAEKEQQERDREAARERRRIEKEQARMAAEAALAAVPDPDDTDSVSSETEEKIKARREKGHVNLVFDALVEAKVPMSISKMAEMTGLTRDQAGAAAVNLCNGGSIMRVKQGVYKAKEQYAATEVHMTVEPQPVQMTERAAEAIVDLVDIDRTLRGDKALEQRVERRPVLDEDVANDILDLLFPQGFKARHLPAIERWKEATEYLIHEVQGG